MRKLKNGNDEDYQYEFESEPICPYCDEEFNISDNEAYELCEESWEDREITCDSCHKDFMVSTCVILNYCTRIMDHDKPKKEETESGK
jgi:hypothetical protein